MPGAVAGGFAGAYIVQGALPDVAPVQVGSLERGLVSAGGGCQSGLTTEPTA